MIAVILCICQWIPAVLVFALYWQVRRQVRRQREWREWQRWAIERMDAADAAGLQEVLDKQKPRK